ncbi:amidohydrolase family protein [Azospirillum sp. BE72]|uniref:metal-dependent hydrolase family protein n=1 Tax=Azospirillum sp. BE72 TaxID=2817776 RepID=UPI00285955A7|nr:amidohydrolase family protein [Azospirillum sp. BE72]MDR6775668.1 imidazolonepropionase-like amidohydrolase [Azospirillum sp. BE72]
MPTTLFTNVQILDSTGEKPYAGEVLVQGNRIAEVARQAGTISHEAHRVVDGGGATLMSGLCDAHTHFSWINQAGLDPIGLMPVEEHILEAADNARTYLDCGYTMCVGAAAAKPRLDVVVRDYINKGRIAGPRYLANGPEIATIGGLGDLNPSHVGAYTFVEVVNGPYEMRACVRRLLKEGVDLIKLNLSGEEITKCKAEDTPMAEDEIAEAVREAHRKKGVRICAHARSAESVKLCVKYGIEIIYHASFADEEALDLLEANKDKHFVAPGLAWVYQTCHAAADWGITEEVARNMGYFRELESAIETMKAMRRRGIRVLPGGDYGFAWTPHGTYAKDLEYFVELLGFTPMEAIQSATLLGGEIMGRPGELGLVRNGYLADLILLDGDPLQDITLFQDRSRILAIMKDGSFHKEMTPPARAQVSVAA